MFVGDVTVPNIEGEYILLFGIVFHEKNICLPGLPTKNTHHRATQERIERAGLGIRGGRVGV